MDQLGWNENFLAGARRARRNMMAAVSYMLEPTESKAEAIREALRSWTATKQGRWTHDGQNAGWVQLSLAFLYDLLYNSGVLTEEDKNHFDDWFAWEAKQLIMPNDWWVDLGGRDQGRVTIEKEGSARQDYANWWTIRISCGLVCAMVAHDQSLVDLGFNSSVPSTYYSSDISQYAPDTRDLENLIAGSVFPSGYDWDGYHRGYGFDAPDESYTDAGKPHRGQGQTYHFYSVFPLLYAAEAATHNGDHAFDYGNQALLRTFKRASDWAPTAYRSNGPPPTEDYRQLYWLIYRRHPDDPDVTRMVRGAPTDEYWFRIADKTAFVWGALGSIH